MFEFLNKMRKVGHKGFTLVELMIVVAIIGILAAIAIPQFAAYRTRGFNASALSDARNIATSEAALFADWQTFGITFTGAALPGPGNAAGVGVLITGPSTARDGITCTDSAVVFRGLNIPVGNNVSVIVDTNAGGAGASNFIGGAKHFQGNTIYGVDSDVTALYQDPLTLAVGVILAGAQVPAPTAVDDFALAAGNWVAK